MSWPVALRGRAVRIGTTSAKAGTSFSRPTIATWILGRVVTRRAFPSFVTRTSVPVSATAMLAPEIPMSASRNVGRSSLRATFTRRGMSVASRSSTSLLKISATSSFVRWIAGITMCEGRWPASWMIHSPRSVSLTSMPASVEGLVEVDLLGGHRLRLRDLLHALLAGEVDDVAADLLGALQEDDLRAARLGLLRERGPRAPGSVRRRLPSPRRCASAPPRSRPPGTPSRG